MLAINVLYEILRQVGVTDTNQFNGYLILGYVVMWVIAMVYIFSLANRQRNVREEIKLLIQLLREDEETDEK